MALKVKHITDCIWTPSRGAKISQSWDLDQLLSELCCEVSVFVAAGCLRGDKWSSVAGSWTSLLPHRGLFISGQTASQRSLYLVKEAAVRRAELMLALREEGTSQAEERHWRQQRKLITQQKHNKIRAQFKPWKKNEPRQLFTAAEGAINMKQKLRRHTCRWLQVKPAAQTTTAPFWQKSYKKTKTTDFTGDCATSGK